MIIKTVKFDISEIPRFICPKCNIGLLRLIKDSVMHKHPSWISTLPEVTEEATLDYSTGKEIHEVSKMQIVDEPGEEKITSFFLKCDREKCQEVVVTCGTTICELEKGPIQDRCLNESYVDYFYPKYFYPSIRLFEVPEGTPKDVVNELDLAFSLFWSNLSACGNSQRKVLERLIDNIECKDFNDNDKLGVKLNKLGKEYPNFQLFSAIRYIGNDGSHESTLKHEDVILGFELIQKCLFDLYQEKDLESIASTIHINKKPISKIKD